MKNMWFYSINREALAAWLFESAPHLIEQVSLIERQKHIGDYPPHRIIPGSAENTLHGPVTTTMEFA